MSQKSTIEWTDATWNPVRGCNKVSAGCTNCYAETFAERWRGIKGHPYEFGFDLRLVPGKLEEPLKWKKPRRIFVNSMSDLFHEKVPEEYVEQVFDVMLRAPQHTYQILTKRAVRMRELLQGSLSRFSGSPHIWLGVSAEDEKYGMPRIRSLVETPAAVRFVSCEPLLAPIDFLAILGTDEDCALFRRIKLVIVGGESGPGCRPMNLKWARSLCAQCRDAGVAYFLKQLGGHPNKRHQLTDFPEDLRIREMPTGVLV